MRSGGGGRLGFFSANFGDCEMTLKEMIARMLADSEALYEAVDGLYGENKSPVRSTAAHVRANLKRLNNFVNGRKPVPKQGVGGETPKKELAGLKI